MKAQRIIFVGAFYVMLAMYAVRYRMFVGGEMIDYVLTVCIAFSAALACIADSKVVSRPMVHIAKVGLLVYWPVTVAVYLVWSRGWRGMMWVMVHLCAIAGLMIGTAVLLADVLHIYPR